MTRIVLINPKTRSRHAPDLVGHEIDLNKLTTRSNGWTGRIDMRNKCTKHKRRIEQV